MARKANANKLRQWDGRHYVPGALYSYMLQQRVDQGPGELMSGSVTIVVRLHMASNQRQGRSVHGETVYSWRQSSYGS